MQIDNLVNKIKYSWHKVYNSYTYNLLRSYLGLQIISQINSLVSLFFVAKYLGPANLGLISYAQYLAMMTVFTGSGIDTYTTYKLLRHPEERETSQIFARSYRAKILLSIIGVLIVLPIVIWKSDNSYELTMYITSITLATFSCSFLSLFASYSISHRLVPSFNRSAMVASISILISRIAFVYYHLPAIYFLIILLCDTIVTLSIFIIFNFKLMKSRNLFFDLNIYKKHFKEAIYLKSFLTFIKNETANAIHVIYEAKYYLGIYVFSLLASRADLYMLKFYVSNHDLGIYSAALRLAEYPGVASGIIGNVLIISLALSARSKIRYGAIAIGYTSNIILALSFIVLFAVFGSHITRFIYGEAYTGVDKVLFVYSIGIIGIFVNNFSSLIFMIHKKEKYLLYSSIVGSIMLASLCWLWIPVYGLYGAAIASSITYISVSILSLAAAYRIEVKHKRNNDITLL